MSQIPCPDCGQFEFDLMSTELHKQVFRCQHCGHEITTRMVPGDELQEQSMVEVMANIGNDDELNVTKLMKLKKLWLHGMSIGQIKEAAEANAGMISLGSHSAYHAEELAAVAEEHGISVEFRIMEY